MTLLFSSKPPRLWREIALEITQEMDATRIKELTTEMLQALPMPCQCAEDVDERFVRRA